MKPKKNSDAPLTMPEIVSTVQAVVARSERSIRDDLSTLGIKPLGKRQRPQRYSPFAPWQVLNSLGYPVAASNLPPLDTAHARLVVIQAEGTDKAIRSTIKKLNGKANR